jgi:uncharacterized protein (TIGR03085 family)
MLGCMSFSSAERRRLAELFHELGPDVPTLCEGWTAHHLAAHLLVRENQPVATAGMFVPPLAGRLESAMQAQLDRDFSAVVEEWAAGPGTFNPMRFADRMINTAEHFIHHEDLRRGGGLREWAPRDFSQAVDDQLYSSLSTIARGLVKGSDKPVVFVAGGRKPVVAARGRGVAERGDDVVRVSGEPGELLLWAFGRDAVEVTVEGDVAAVSR